MNPRTIDVDSSRWAIQQDVPLLRFENVSKRFDGITALQDVSLEINKGDITGLIGPNGAGKTTVFNLITGVYRPSSGNIYLAGNRLIGLPSYRIARLGIARTFQNIRLFPSMTVLEHVLISQLSDRPWWNRFASFTHEHRSAVGKAEKILTLTGLSGVRDRLATTLPYGLQRSVEIARALASEPELILLDEPVAGMNRDETSAMHSLLVRLRERGASLLIIEHDMSFIMNLCDHLYVLDFGNLIASGPPKAIRADPTVLNAYLGEESDG
jgi:ABC-type branched-subunit amino acid transport system ATPase component